MLGGKVRSIIEDYDPQYSASSHQLVFLPCQSRDVRADKPFRSRLLDIKLVAEDSRSGSFLVKASGALVS
jgi:hypothetical protein